MIILAILGSFTSQSGKSAYGGGTPEVKAQAHTSAGFVFMSIAPATEPRHDCQTLGHPHGA